MVQRALFTCGTPQVVSTIRKVLACGDNHINLFACYGGSHWFPAFFSSYFLMNKYYHFFLVDVIIQVLNKCPNCYCVTNYVLFHDGGLP